MAFLNIPSVSIRGVVSCVPAKVDNNRDYNLPQEDIERFIDTVGVERKRIVDDDVCTSDLCVRAAERLISELGWDKNDISFLIFVTQTPDYITPATSCIIQHRLGLSNECFTQDISLGCSGWVYGLSTLASLVTLSRGKGLLLVGDTISKFISKEDKSTWMLFGDAGSATAVEYDETSMGFQFHLASDGEGYETIMIRDGGYRNPVTNDSLTMESFGAGISHNRLQLVLDGMNVFTFGISKAPKSIKSLIEHFNIDPATIKQYFFHQANMLMNEKIRSKLKLTPEQVPYSLRQYGNTSCATIPLTMCTSAYCSEIPDGGGECCSVRFRGWIVMGFSLLPS